MKSFLRLPLLILGLVSIVAVSGCNSFSKKRDYDPTVARFLLEAAPGEAFAATTLPVSGVQIAVDSKPVITEFDIINVQLAKSDMGQFLLFQLTPEAARDLYRFTGNNQGRRLVLTINGKAVGARQIDRPFGTGSVATFVEISDDLLPALIKNINGTSDEIQKEIAKNKS
jgi:hypothetical protein